MNVSCNQILPFKILRMFVSVWKAEMTPRDPIYPMSLQRSSNYTIASLFLSHVKLIKCALLKCLISI